MQLNSRIRPCVALIQFYRAIEQMAVPFRAGFVAWLSSPKHIKDHELSLGAAGYGSASKLARLLCASVGAVFP